MVQEFATGFAFVYALEQVRERDEYNATLWTCDRTTVH